MEAEIKADYPTATVSLVKGGGGVFDVVVDANTVYSKKKESCGGFPEPGLVNQRIAAHLKT